MSWLHRIVAACCIVAAVPAALAGPSAAELAAKEVRAAAGAQRLLLLGETHGTREAPELVRHLAAAYAGEGPVLVALEVRAAEQAAFNRYLASDGGPAERAALVAGPFWQVPPERNDGRRTQDAIAVIEAVRQLRAAGRDVAVLAMDPARPTDTDSERRDAVMARLVRVAFEHLPRGRMLVLTGNVHAMEAKPHPLHAPPRMQTPMGSRLTDLDPFSVHIHARSGEFWACSGTCGPLPVNRNNGMSGPSRLEMYDYSVVLPEFTAARLIRAR